MEGFFSLVPWEILKSNTHISAQVLTLSSPVMEENPKSHLEFNEKNPSVPLWKEQVTNPLTAPK